MLEKIECFVKLNSGGDGGGIGKDESENAAHWVDRLLAPKELLTEVSMLSFVRRTLHQRKRRVLSDSKVSATKIFCSSLTSME